MPTPQIQPSTINRVLAEVLRLARSIAGGRSPLLGDFEEAAVDGLVVAWQGWNGSEPSFRHLALAASRLKILERSRSLHCAKRDRRRNVALSATSELAQADRPTFSFDELVEPLPESDRRLLSLRFVDAFTLDELAELLGLHERKVRRRISHALDQLRNLQEAS